MTKVIIRHDTKLGSGTIVDVYEYDPEYGDEEQLNKLIEREYEWFERVDIPVEEKEICDDEAWICGGDYTITYYIREIRKGVKHG